MCWGPFDSFFVHLLCKIYQVAIHLLYQKVIVRTKVSFKIYSLVAWCKRVATTDLCPPRRGQPPGQGQRPTDWPDTGPWSSRGTRRQTPWWASGARRWGVYPLSPHSSRPGQPHHHHPPSVPRHRHPPESSMTPHLSPVSKVSDSLLTFVNCLVSYDVVTKQSLNNWIRHQIRCSWSLCTMLSIPVVSKTQS